jgi:hypothetical protein
MSNPTGSPADLTTTINMYNTTQPLTMQSTRPWGYRLKRMESGEMVLQGAYSWTCGAAGGVEWRDIPTVSEEEAGDGKG